MTYSVDIYYDGVVDSPQVDRTVVSATDYYPYGKALRSYGRERYQSTYHERDVESGFDYRGARFYDSDVGRFNSLDPLAHKYPQLSDYMYVAGNPLRYVDPDGRFVVDADSDGDGKIDKTEKRNARILKKNIRKLRRYIRKADESSSEMLSLMTWGEFKSKKAMLRHIFKNGKGPEVRFLSHNSGRFRRFNARYGFKMMTPDGQGGFTSDSQYGNFKTGEGKYSGISLDSGILRGLKYSRQERHPATVRAGGVGAATQQAFDFFKAVLLHEVAHVGDMVTTGASIENHNPAQDTQPLMLHREYVQEDGGFVTEVGNSFEKAAYGRVAYRNNSGVFIQQIYSSMARTSADLMR